MSLTNTIILLLLFLYVRFAIIFYNRTTHLIDERINKRIDKINEKFNMPKNNKYDKRMKIKCNIVYILIVVFWPISLFIGLLLPSKPKTDSDSEEQ